MTSISGDVHSQNSTSTDVDGTRSSKPDTWRSWRLQRAGNPVVTFEGYILSDEAVGF